MGNMKLAYLKKEPSVIPYSLVGNHVLFDKTHNMAPVGQ